MSQSRKRLILARDRLGIKPLYVCSRDGAIAFGSELKVLFAHPEIDRIIMLRNGTIFRDGHRQDLLNTEMLSALFEHPISHALLT